mmetsp:Transcript_16147/g.38038  ORF Transcript_16147/g.38038 Transcript_16147/m.38038 type:complete len:365 (-) Transcript_16147:326-1420(-)|eukprot:CAMPEP_0114561336 /NCGR_PEP_ID=MMETSP0114-20121206/11949_1 /TAXON_ID=31324 /ORGANISM="Goniomonas sp, Strain m" /LENGTH=364 /DNA_ID=CAMNT_0001746963 /DNA_START=23 /DNA_END=1117 /DNA_ORIENTATION=+
MSKGGLLLVALFAIAIIALVEAGADYYKILDLPRDATEQQIKRQYRKLSLKHHPDKNPDDPNAASKFAEIASAYEVLSDKDKRRIYDQHGEEGLKQQGQQHHDPFDLFSMFGGGGFQRGQPQERRGPDINVDLELSLKDLYLGKVLEIEFVKTIVCPKCRGSGAKRAEDVVTCPHCNGQGAVVTRHQIAPGFFQQVQQTCPHCGGAGKTVKSVCSKCHGRKTTRGVSELMIDIEKGMPDGHVIVFDSEGDQNPDYNSGNVNFKVKTRPHPRFTRNGNDLHLAVTITLLEALVGFDIDIPHLDGHVVKVHRDQVTRPDEVERIRGEGMPHHNYSSQRGDLVITYSVKMPKSLTEAQKASFKALFS